MLLKQHTILTVVLCAVLSNAAQGQATGYWHTSGNQIFDASNQTVRIAGVNWYGLRPRTRWRMDYGRRITAAFSTP
jgi:ribosomal protein S30